MKSIHATLLLSFILVFCATPESRAQDIAIPTDKLQSKSNAERAAAFDAMVRAADARHPAPSRVGPWPDWLAEDARRRDTLAVTLIALLERENTVLAHPPYPDDFDVEGYYGNLLTTVIKMRDPRSARALIPGLAMSGGAQTVMADFGTAAVPALLLALKDQNRSVRSSAAQVFGMIAKRRVELRISAATFAGIRAALLDIVATQDAAIVRMSAVSALVSFGGDDIRRQMVRIAATDSSTSDALPGHPRGFPVRVEAQKWLAAHPGP